MSSSYKILVRHGFTSYEVWLLLYTKSGDLYKVITTRNIISSFYLKDLRSVGIPVAYTGRVMPTLEENSTQL